MKINWFAITIISIWICSTIGVILTKDVDGYTYSVVVTVITGIGYLFYKDSH